MGQYLKGKNMTPIQSRMADVRRMRKFLVLIASVRAKIQLNLQKYSWDRI